MFHGITLTQKQITAIVMLSEQLKKKRQNEIERLRIGKARDSATKIRLLPLIAQERQAYRKVLTPEQWIIFDQNSRAILDGWLSADLETPQAPSPARPEVK